MTKIRDHLQQEIDRAKQIVKAAEEDLAFIAQWSEADCWRIYHIVATVHRALQSKA